MIDLEEEGVDMEYISSCNYTWEGNACTDFE